MSKVQLIRTTGGEEMVVLSRADFEQLVDDPEMLDDIRLYDEAKAALAAGEDELIPSEVVDRLLSGESEVRVWREFRGLPREELADRAGIEEARLAEIEDESADLRVSEIQALAPVLKVDLEDLLPRPE
jgi:DNA-binding Xre family transcriptional regulator